MPVQLHLLTVCAYLSFQMYERLFYGRSWELIIYQDVLDLIFFIDIIIVFFNYLYFERLVQQNEISDF